MRWVNEGQSSIGDASYRGAKLLGLVGFYTTASQLAQAMPEVFDGSETVINRGNSLVNPPQLVVVNQDRDKLIVASLGVNQREHAVRIADGWLSDWPVNQPFPSPYYQDAEALLSVIPTPASGWRQVVMVGHSWGGAICRSLMSLLRRRDFTTNFNIWLYTYGAPKYDRTEFWNFDIDFPQRRIMTKLDLVPRIAPSVANLGGISLALPNNLLRRLGEQCTGPGGLTFDDSGNLVGTVVDPPITANYTWTDLLGLLLSPQMFTSDVHELPYYLVSLLGNRIPDPVPVDSAPPPSPRPLRSVPTVEEIDDARQVAFVANSTIAESDPSKIVSWAQQIVIPTPGVKFRLGKRQHKRGVFFGSQLVCSVRSKRAGRSLKDLLNNQLRVATFGFAG